MSKYQKIAFENVKYDDENEDENVKDGYKCEDKNVKDDGESEDELEWITECQVQIVQCMGSDKTVVNAARVSFNKDEAEQKDVEKKDHNLIKFLAKHKHFSPFRHPHVMMILTMPEFVARQMYKHIVGIDITTSPVKDHAWNEVSMRYIPINRFFKIKTWKNQHKSAKQCSAEPVPDQTNQLMINLQTKLTKIAFKAYKSALDVGIAKEQARTLLPLNVVTKVWWTASLQAVANFLKLRDAPDAQGEIQVLARKIKEAVEPHFPISLKALLEI